MKGARISALLLVALAASAHAQSYTDTVRVAYRDHVDVYAGCWIVTVIAHGIGGYCNSATAEPPQPSIAGPDSPYIRVDLFSVDPGAFALVGGYDYKGECVAARAQFVENAQVWDLQCGDFVFVAGFE